MRYKSARRVESDGKPKKIFYVTLASAVMLFAAFFLMMPPAFGDLVCDRSASANGDKGCGCPTSDDAIRYRNVIVVDTTDPLRKGKYDDIERLVNSVGTTPRSFWQWLVSGKKTDMTSVFVLSDTPVADMQPVAKFCSPPPEFALLIGFKGTEVNALIGNMKARTKEAIFAMQSASTASQSPIVETLATVVRSSSHWAPGSTLIVASDLIENSPTCGYFEKLPTIPPLNSVPSACDNLVRTLQEGLRPNQAHPGTSVVAFCTLPGKSEKPGLRVFWSDISRGALQSDALFSCDPAVIQSRREFLIERTK